LDEGRGQAIELPRFDAALEYRVLKRLVFFESTHDHEPIHDRSATAN
jgi:hypothetical protein